jgi:hypothetical protein
MEEEMKKLFAILAAAMLVVGAAGSAMAYSSGDLVQYIYEGTTDAGIEFNTGLGNIDYIAGSTLLQGNSVTTAGQPASDLSDFDSGWADMYAGFTTQYSLTEVVGLAFQKDTTTVVAFATTTDTLPTVDTSSFTLFSGNAATLTNTIPTGANNKAQAVSYWESIEFESGLGNVQGNYAGFNNDPAVGFGSLAGLAAGAGSFVDMYLWQYQTFDGFFAPDTEGFIDATGAYNDTYSAVLRIGLNETGDFYTEINPAPVPVPAAVWLLGSGLLGLIGIRRRNA